MKVLVSGSHGFIGSALCAELTQRGHSVIPLVRTPTSGEHIVWNIASRTIDVASLNDASPDAVVHLAGEGIANKRWTTAQKDLIRSSRTVSTDLLATALTQLAHPPKIFISGSAVGYYGSRGDQELDETSTQGNDFLSDVCTQWEEATQPARSASIPTAIIRTGHVLDPSGSMLKKILLPFRLGIGGRIGDGNQYMSWITRSDHIAALIYLMENELPGTYNLSAPNPVTNEEFTRLLGAQLNRPTILPTPLAPLRIRYGSELVDTLLLSSQRAIPRALQSHDFTFAYTDLAVALKELLS